MCVKYAWKRRRSDKEFSQNYSIYLRYQYQLWLFNFIKVSVPTLIKVSVPTLDHLSQRARISTSHSQRQVMLRTKDSSSSVGSKVNESHRRFVVVTNGLSGAQLPVQRQVVSHQDRIFDFCQCQSNHAYNRDFCVYDLLPSYGTKSSLFY